MSKKISYAITDNNVTVNYDGQTHIVGRNEALADKLIAALREGRKDEIPDLVSASKRIETYGEGAFEVRNGVIFVNGQEVHDILSRKILQFQAEKLPSAPLVKFAANLQKNPSFRAVNELFNFLEKNDHPITDEGNFIAYKRVRGSFKDIHSNTMDNSVGKTVEMPRNAVNEDSSQTCSQGLHVANWNYAHTQFASSDPETDIMLEIEVNPADVVSIPVDYNNSKMRVCKYKVLGVVDREHSSDVHLRQTTVADDGSVDIEIEEEEVLEEVEPANTCNECGEVTDEGFDLCEECELPHEEDDYPWDDELSL